MAPYLQGNEALGHLSAVHISTNSQEKLCGALALPGSWSGEGSVGDHVLAAGPVRSLHERSPFPGSVVSVFPDDLDGSGKRGQAVELSQESGLPALQQSHARPTAFPRLWVCSGMWTRLAPFQGSTEAPVGLDCSHAKEKWLCRGLS